jgi:hypothetical protein
MLKTRKLLYLLLVLLPLVALAAAPAGWQAAREIASYGHHEYKEFFLDDSVYRHAKEDLSDLRIVDKNGEGIPYLIQGGYHETKSMPQVVKHAEGLTSITLDNSDRLQVLAIKLEIIENHQRRYRLIAEGKQITSGEIVKLKMQDTDIDRTAINFPGYISSATITIEIDNRDDRPLTIEEIRVDYQVHRLVFPVSGEPPYVLYYGNPKAEKPSYDIERFRNHIEKEPKDTVRLGRFLQMPPEPDPPAKPLHLGVLFNITIIGVSLFLIILVSRHLWMSGGSSR